MEKSKEKLKNSKEKLASDRLKAELIKRKQELPKIQAILASHEKFLELRKDLVDLNPPLHDIAQNLSVYAPELAPKYMIAVCMRVNDYALSKHLTGLQKVQLFFWDHLPFLHKLTKKNYGATYNVLLLQRKRLNELKAAFKKDEDIIHPFTEIVDNLQRIVPEKFLELAEALYEYNKAAIYFYRVTEENYRLLKP